MRLFISAALSILISVPAFTAQAQIRLTPQQATEIGQKIWHNEGLGKIENLTVWNKGEDFPSFGIGHFIWYPAGFEGPFTESFPALIDHLAQTNALPAWLKNQRDAPWANRDAFYADIDGARLKSLRKLLARTTGRQVEFIISRLQAALPAMTAAIDEPQLRAHVQQQFNRVAAHPHGVYVLIDYVNFKGEGTSPKERYKGQGWGLLQVLEGMPADAPDVLAAFAESADAVLTRRVANAPRDESRWLAGWRNRIKTYHAP